MVRAGRASAADRISSRPRRCSIAAYAFVWIAAMFYLVDDLAPAEQGRSRHARARRRRVTAPMTAGHFIFIPSVLLDRRGDRLDSRARAPRAMPTPPELRRREEATKGARVSVPTAKPLREHVGQAGLDHLRLRLFDAILQSKQLDAPLLECRRSRRRRADRRRAAGRPIPG